MNALRRVRTHAGDRSGAVYVEFLIAFMPLFLMFSGLFQLGMLQIASLVTQHAAVTAARAAAVILPDNKIFYDDSKINVIAGARYADILSAAQTTLSAIDPSPRVEVRFPSSAGGTDNQTEVGAFDVLHAQVIYQYACRIPIGNLLVCGLDGTKTLTGESAMPNQGNNEGGG